MKVKMTDDGDYRRVGMRRRMKAIHDGDDGEEGDRRRIGWLG